MIMFFAFISIFAILLARSVNPSLVAVDFKALRSFARILGAVFLIRMIVLSFTKIGPPSDLMDHFSFDQFLMVYWEDMFFVFPSLLFGALFPKSKLIIPIMLISSLSFAGGHIYQSYTWAAMTIAYVPVMFNIAKKHGLGTVMIGHIAYDMSTYVTMLLAGLLL